MIYRLIVLTGPLKKQRITVDPQPMTIGRDTDCTISIPDEEMAKHHASLEQRGDALYIRDLGSMNRILVNQREVKEKRLQHGDMVELGRTRFLIQVLVQAEVEGARKVTPRRRQWRAVGVAVVLVLGAVVAANIKAWRGDRKLKLARAASESAAPVVETGAVVEDILIPDPAVSEDLRLVREDLEAIRESVRALTNRALTRATEPGATPRDVIQQKAASMFTEARQAVADGNPIKADQLLAGVQVLEPEYIPAFEERARLYERRGMPDQAIQQWNAIVELNPPPEIFEKAVGERLRLSQEKQTPGRPLVRIAAAEQHKVLTAGDHDEMRILRVGLKQRSQELLLDPELVRVEVAFFDEDADDGRVFSTRVIVPQPVLRPESPWNAAEMKTVTASYVVPKGMRGRSQYYGYVIRVYYNEQLQDTRAQPKTLLQRAGPSGGAGGGGA